MVEKGIAQGIVVKKQYLKLYSFHFEENIQLFLSIKIVKFSLSKKKKIQILLYNKQNKLN